MNGIMTDYYQRQSAATSSTSKIASVSTNTESESGQSTVIDSGVSNKYDTLELSQDYVNYKMQNESSTVEDDANLLNSQTSQAPPPPPPVEETTSEVDVIASATEETEETEETTATASTVSTERNRRNERYGETNGCTSSSTSKRG